MDDQDELFNFEVLRDEIRKLKDDLRVALLRIQMLEVASKLPL